MPICVSCETSASVAIPAGLLGASLPAARHHRLPRWHQGDWKTRPRVVSVLIAAIISPCATEAVGFRWPRSIRFALSGTLCATPWSRPSLLPRPCVPCKPPIAPSRPLSPHGSRCVNRWPDVQRPRDGRSPCAAGSMAPRHNRHVPQQKQLFVSISRLACRLSARPRRISAGSCELRVRMPGLRL